VVSALTKTSKVNTILKVVIFKHSVILCVEETYYFICVVGGVYRISNFLMAKEVNKEVKKKLQHQCL
jgi:hypothetical protein